MTISVTKAQADDADLFVDMSRRWADEFAIGQRFSAGKVERLFGYLRENGCVLIASDGLLPVGFISGLAVDPWFGEGLIAMPFATYLLPLHRGGAAADMLVMSFQEWCVSRGCERVDVILLGGAETFAPVVERAGFAPIGQAFAWRPGGAVASLGIDRH